MATEYTPEMLSELRAEGQANDGIDNEFALAFAERHGISVQSVRQKAVRDEDIGYRAKPKTRKDGSPVENKAAIVEDIAGLIGKDADLFSSLENANRSVLVDIRGALEMAVAVASGETE